MDVNMHIVTDINKILFLFQLRYLNGVMVIGTCDSALEFWVPNKRYNDL